MIHKWENKKCKELRKNFKKVWEAFFCLWNQPKSKYSFWLNKKVLKEKKKNPGEDPKYLEVYLIVL